MAVPLLQAPPLSVLDNLRQPVDAMIAEVASLVGGDDDPIGRQRALVWLDRAADRMNMAGTFLYRHKEKVYNSTSVTMNQASSFELPVDWGWPTDPITLYDSSNGLLGYAQWKTWDQIQRFIHVPDVYGIPAIFSLRSDLSDGLLYFYPFVDGNTVSEIRVSYLARLQRPSEAEELAIWPETREALIAGGEFFAMRHRHAAQPAIWRPFEDTFMRSIEGAKAAASRWIEATHPAIVPDLDGWAMPGMDNLGTSNRRQDFGPSYIIME